MNSDKMDQFFKGQIDSLDRIPVPGSSWTPDKSWEAVSAGLKPRRKIVFWWYGSAAALVLVILAFWWLNSSLLSEKIFLTNVGVDESGIIPQTEEVLQESKQVDLPENINGTKINTDAIASDQTNSVVMNSNATNISETLRRNDNKLMLITLAYLPEGFRIPVSDFQIASPEYIHSSTELTGSKKKATLVNRTYIIKKNKIRSNPSQKSTPDLKLRIDLAMTSENDPPSGMFRSLMK